MKSVQVGYDLKGMLNHVTMDFLLWPVLLKSEGAFDKIAIWQVGFRAGVARGVALLQ